GVGNHGFQKLGGDDHAGAEFMAAFDDPALEDGKFLEGDFHTEVAAGDHDDIGGMDDGVDIPDGFLVLDFGDDLCLAFKGFHGGTEFADVGGVANERAGDVVRAALDGEGEVLVVLVGEGGEVQP